jgi:hypothetical protein
VGAHARPGVHGVAVRRNPAAGVLGGGAQVAPTPRATVPGAVFKHCGVLPKL